MNKPLPRSRYGKKFAENYDQIFGEPEPHKRYLVEVWSIKENRAVGWSGTEEGALAVVKFNNLKQGEYKLEVVEVQE